KIPNAVAKLTIQICSSMVGVVSNVITSGVIQKLVQSNVSFLALVLNLSTTKDVTIAAAPTIKTVVPKINDAAISKINSATATNSLCCCEVFIIYSSQVLLCIF